MINQHGTNNNNVDWKFTLDSIKKRTTIDWNIITNRIKDHKCIPIVGSSLASGHVFNPNDILELWSNEQDLKDIPIFTKNIHFASQYASVMLPDSLAAKESYLNILKIQTLILAQKTLSLDELYIRTVIEELNSLSVTNLYTRLFDTTNQTMSQLVELPFSIYITTDFHKFIEKYLEKIGKKSISLAFPNDIDSKEINDSVLVYHVFGIETSPESMILSCDDHINFILKSSQSAIPHYIKSKLLSNSLLMIDFDVLRKEFTTLLNGLLIPHRKNNNPLYSTAIQCSEENQKIREYIRKLLKKYNFNIFWGNTKDFVDKLYQKYQETL